MKLVRNCIFFLLASLCCCSLLHAQDEPVYGARQRPPKFGLDTIHGYLNLKSNWSSDTSSGTSGSRTSTRELTFEEALNLYTTGYILTPNFIFLNLDGTFGLTQENLNENGQQSYNDSTLYSWDTSATIFRNEWAPLTLYTSRSQSMVHQTFGPTVRDTESTYGAFWQLRSQSIPTELRAYHAEQFQSALSSQEHDFDLSRDVFEWHSEGKPAPRQNLQWTYRIESSDQQSVHGVNQTSDAQAASLSHAWQLDKESSTSLLNSGLSWTKVDGLLEYETQRWSEELTLEHSKTFQTNYNYLWEQQDYTRIQQTRQRASGGFRHMLYESLVTSGRAGWQNIGLSDDSATRNLFANLDFNYHKRVPLGALVATLGLGYDQTTNSARALSVPIVDQSFAFSDFTPVTIQERNVVLNSIVLKNSAGQFFQPGDGYLVTPIPNGFQLQAIPGGPIATGQPLLLSYDLGATPANTITTNSLNAGLRYEIKEGLFKGLSPYGSYGTNVQSVDGGSDVILPNTMSRWIYGVDYRIGELQLRAEREHVNSHLYPYDVDRLEARYDRRLSRSAILSLSSEYTSTEYPNQRSQNDTMLISGTWTKEITNRLTASATVSWIDIRDRAFGQTRGLEEQLQLTWILRQSEAFLRLRNSQVDTPRDDRDFQYLEIGFRRNF